MKIKTNIRAGAGGPSAGSSSSSSSSTSPGQKHTGVDPIVILPLNRCLGY